MPRGAGCALTPPTECCRFDYLSDLSHEDDPATTLERINDKYRCTNPADGDCSSSINPDCDPGAWDDQIIQGGGIYWGCTVAEIRSVNLGQVTTRVQLERDDTDGNGPEVVRFEGLPDDGEFHVYATVYTEDGRFIGAEEARVFLPDGSSQRIYTSARQSEGGRWWYVGYFFKDRGGQVRFSQFNYDKLEKTPVRFKDGYELELQVLVRSGKDGTKLSAVEYTLLSPEWEYGSPLDEDEEPYEVSRGALPGGTVAFENMASWWLGDAMEPITYVVELRKVGYVTKTMEVTYMPGQYVQHLTAILAEDKPKVLSAPP